jgi:hypothetical protein
VVFEKAIRLPDGRYRASTSLFLEGKALGPFTYQGTRDQDPNDVIPHEDRRELRGARVLAAWTNHFDSREQNTLSMWRGTGGGRGYVQHDLLDFADCFGSVWEPPLLARRIGRAYYLDFGYVAEDFLTLGVMRRPWDDMRFGPSGRVFGYYDVESFDPDQWKPGYPNPAFSRMTERDAAWMARIVSQITDEHLLALAEVGRFRDRFLEREILRLLRGRRDRITGRYLSRLSPLSHPMIERRGSAAWLCLRDLGVDAGVAVPSSRLYVARVWAGAQGRPVGVVPPVGAGSRACVRLPRTEVRPDAPEYLVVDMLAGNGVTFTGPARVHLYALGGAEHRIVGLERPAGHEPPAG